MVHGNWGEEKVLQVEIMIKNKNLDSLFKRGRVVDDGGKMLMVMTG